MRKSRKIMMHDYEKAKEIIELSKASRTETEEILAAMKASYAAGDLDSISLDDFEQLRENNNQFMKLLDIAEKLLSEETDRTVSGW